MDETGSKWNKCKVWFVSFLLPLLALSRVQTIPYNTKAHSFKLSSHLTAAPLAMAAPAAAAAGSKRERERDPPGPVTTPPLTRWDHLLPAARLAGEHAETQWGVEHSFTKYTSAFRTAIRRTILDRTTDERNLIDADAFVAYCVHRFEVSNSTRDKTINTLYNRIMSTFKYSKPARFVTTHQLRRLHQHPEAWAAFIQKLADIQELAAAARPTKNRADEWHFVAKMRDAGDASELAAFIRELFEPEIERTRFDASQVERHMAMTHRVPADVTNLIGQFATSAITAQAPIPLRLQVKHRLELLTRRVASLTATQVAAEMRDILGEVEAALPEDQRVPKKART
jgi:hypothetical protein